MNWLATLVDYFFRALSMLPVIGGVALVLVAPPAVGAICHLLSKRRQAASGRPRNNP